MKQDKKKLILKMLNAGKSYTDIIATLDVSPSSIAVVKKKEKLKKEIIEKKISDLTPNLFTSGIEKKEQIEYFPAKYLLEKKLTILNDGKSFYVGFNKHSIYEEENIYKIRIKLQKYIIKRLSRREYTLEKTQ